MIKTVSAEQSRNVKEGCTPWGPSLAQFMSGKNSESWFSEHGYQNVIFPDHKNKQIMYSF